MCLPPFRQQAAVLWKQQGSWLWMWSLLSSQKSVLGVTLCSCGSAVEDATHCHAFQREGTAQLPALQTTTGSDFGTRINRAYFRQNWKGRTRTNHKKRIYMKNRSRPAIIPWKRCYHTSEMMVFLCKPTNNTFILLHSFSKRSGGTASLSESVKC